jgi:hypothetical protein
LALNAANGYPDGGDHARENLDEPWLTRSDLLGGLPMTAHPTRTDLPPQLRALSAKAPALQDAVRDALQATLWSAPQHATPQQVLSDAFARLGYLPEEAKRATLRLLA